VLIQECHSGLKLVCDGVVALTHLFLKLREALGQFLVDAE